MYKINDGVEKWILRQAVEGLLPKQILNRPKAKFWAGGGLLEVLHDHAEKNISLVEFDREKMLPNGWILNSKEELMYYRIFKQYYKEVADLSWMGRTQQANWAAYLILVNALLQTFAGQA